MDYDVTVNCPGGADACCAKACGNDSCTGWDIKGTTPTPPIDISECCSYKQCIQDAKNWAVQCAKDVTIGCAPAILLGPVMYKNCMSAGGIFCANTALAYTIGCSICKMP